MDGLRWLLLLFGVLVVAGVYLAGRRQRKQPDESGSRPSGHGRVEPSLGDDDAVEDAAGIKPQIDGAPGDAPGDGDADTAPVAQKIVTLRIVARGNGTINGEELALNLRGIGMRHGKFGIFHCFDGSDEDRVIFSAASLVEPGTFDMATIREQELPGISLFMVLPGPMDGAESFDLMMKAARALKQSLNAELLDESGSTLSIQRERYLREEIIHFQHSILVAEPVG